MQRFENNLIFWLARMLLKFYVDDVGHTAPTI